MIVSNLSQANPSALRLQAGCSLVCHVRAGAVLHLDAGAVILREPPMWLANALLWPRHTLHGGTAWTAGRGGWYEVDPLCDSVLFVHSPPRLFSLQRFARILRGWRGHAGGRPGIAHRLWRKHSL